MIITWRKCSNTKKVHGGSREYYFTFYIKYLDFQSVPHGKIFKHVGQIVLRRGVDENCSFIYFATQCEHIAGKTMYPFQTTSLFAFTFTAIWTYPYSVFTLSDTETNIDADKKWIVVNCMDVFGTALNQMPTHIPIGFCANLSVSVSGSVNAPLRLHHCQIAS